MNKKVPGTVLAPLFLFYSRSGSRFMKALLLVGVAILATGQVETDQKAQSAARLELMKETASRIEIRWHFGMASACVWELHAKHGETEVWSRPKWHHEDADKIYGLVGPFAVAPKLLPAAAGKSN